MNKRYQFFKDKITNTTTYLDTINHCWIPEDLHNNDYQEYLSWLAEGNAPEEWKPE